MQGNSSNSEREGGGNIKAWEQHSSIRLYIHRHGPAMVHRVFPTLQAKRGFSGSIIDVLMNVSSAPIVSLPWYGRSPRLMDGRKIDRISLTPHGLW